MKVISKQQKHYKKPFFLLLATLIFVSCNNKNHTPQVPVQYGSATFLSFGSSIDTENSIQRDSLAGLYESLKIGDSLALKVAAPIKKVCTKKGCWMTLDMGVDKEVMVRFKDYSFFVPTNASGLAYVDGLAFVEETSVEDLRHYAKDAGEDKATIDAINVSEKSYSFVATAVLIQVN